MGADTGKRTKDALAKRLGEAFTLAGVPDGRGRRSAIAKRYGVSVETARKWLVGESVPETWRFAIFAKDAGVSADWLLTGRGGRTYLIEAKTASEVGTGPNARVIADTRGIYDAGIKRDIDRLIQAAMDGKISRERLKHALALLLDDV